MITIFTNTVMKERSDYYYFYEITTRWMDNDIYQHINNVHYYSYFDTATNNYLIEHGGLNIHTDNIVGFIVSSSCQYLSPIRHPSILNVGFRVNHLGSSSVEYGLAIFVQNEKGAFAHGTFTHVFVDRQTNKSAPIPQSVRRALEKAIK